MSPRRQALAVISMIVMTYGIIACESSDESNSSPTPVDAPSSPVASASPTPTWANPFLNVFGQYPSDGSDNISTRTTVQFRLYEDLPVMRVSLSPSVPLERVDFDQSERAPRYVDGEFISDDSVGHMFIFRPEALLEPEATYEVTLEIGDDEDSVVTHTWRFTTDDGVEPDYANQVAMPTLLSNGEGGLHALLVGELVVDGPCVFIGDERDRLPLFEEGTAWWEGDTLFLRGNRYEVGDEVSLGGGEVRHIDRLLFVAEPDESCATATSWINTQ